MQIKFKSFTNQINSMSGLISGLMQNDFTNQINHLSGQIVSGNIVNSNTGNLVDYNALNSGLNKTFSNVAKEFSTLNSKPVYLTNGGSSIGLKTELTIGNKNFFLQYPNQISGQHSVIGNLEGQTQKGFIAHKIIETTPTGFYLELSSPVPDSGFYFISVSFPTGNIFNNFNTISYKKANIINNLYYFDALDVSKTIEFTGNNSTLAIMRDNSMAPFFTGNYLNILQMGSGQITISGSGCSILSRNGAKRTLGQYSHATMIYQQDNQWFLYGDIF